MQSESTIDINEIKKFEAMAAEWWDPKGKFKPLHMLNPCRLEYIIDQIKAEIDWIKDEHKPFLNLRILDIGCGGGLLSEPMARLGASVLGVDPAGRNIEVAKLHAKQVGLEIDYRKTTAEALIEGGEKFDVVLNMEVVEHVPDPKFYLQTCSDLLKSEGLMICSTLNRNLKSYAMAILGAEYIMGWLPKKTHDWNKFITPDELSEYINNSGLKVVDKRGFVFNFLNWDWSLSSSDYSVNYVTSSIKKS